MNNLISVIIPVYNSEKYLSRCLDSIINQTHKNLEIIVINDGSKDNSAVICDKYAKLDSRIIVLHKSNQGVSSARNDGLLISKGKYISFVDSDDYIEENMYEKMMQSITKNNSKICVCNIFYEDSNGNRLKKYSSYNFYTDNIRECLKKLNSVCIQGYCCNKLYSRDVIFKKNSMVKFNSAIFICEDELFNVMVINDNKMSISYINDTLYHYVLHSSNTVNSFNKKSLTLFQALSNEIKIYEINECDTSNLKARYFISYTKLKYILKKNKQSDIAVTSIEKTAKIYSHKICFVKISGIRLKLKYLIAKFLPIIFKIKISIKNNNSIV